MADSFLDSLNAPLTLGDTSAVGNTTTPAATTPSTSSGFSLGSLFSGLLPLATTAENAALGTTAAKPATTATSSTTLLYIVGAIVVLFLGLFLVLGMGRRN